MTDQATQDDRKWMREAIELSTRCPVSEGAYSVGVPGLSKRWYHR